jgi:polysaccharide biosynthesis transport protein
MDLKQLFLVLWQKKWILILVPVTAVFAAFFIRIFGDWKYKSTAQLATGLTVSDKIVERGEYLNPYEIQVTFNNLVEIIRSKAVLGQVSYKLLKHDLSDSVYAFRFHDSKKSDYVINVDEQRSTLLSILENKIDSVVLLNANKTNERIVQRLIDSYRYDYESLIESLAVYRVNQSDFMEVAFTSENPILSAFVVNTVCEEFIKYYSLSKSSRSTVSITSLEGIVGQRKEYLDAKLEELKNFKARNELFNSEAESEAKLRQIKNYEDQITNEQQKIRGLELTIADLSVRIDDAEVTTGQKNYDLIVSLRRRIGEMNDRYIRGGQSDNSLLDSLTNFRNQLDEAMRKVNESSKLTTAEIKELKKRKDESRIDLEIARENLASLNKIYTSIRYGLNDFASKESVGKALEKEVEVARQEFLTAQNRLSEAKEQVATSNVAITQVVVAEPAEKAESRKTLVFMILSGVVSFFVCAFVIIGLELIDTRIKTIPRFRQMTRLKLAGSLPKLPDPDFAWDVSLKANGAHRSSINDEVRKIRFEIDSYNAKVVLITSAQESQGKSFFVIALAYSLSLLKKRVLIIDTNFRNNSLSRMLTAKPNLDLLLENVVKHSRLIGTTRENGKEAAEKSENQSKAYDYDLITRTQNEWIDIIGNRKSRLSPSEIIPGGDFRVLLGWLNSTYDYVLLEGPSLNVFSDTKELVQFVDLVIPIFSAGSSINQVDLDSIAYMKTLKEKLGPAVLNMVENVH